MLRARLASRPVREIPNRDSTRAHAAISPLLFVVIIDVITEEIGEGTPWAMLFADDRVLCEPDRGMMELRLERRR